MKNKGFTMVELLAVIVLMAILLTIAVPSVITISEKIRVDMYCEKIEFIENGAQLWGEDAYDKIFSAPNKTLKVKVSELVNGNYLNKDEVDANDKGIIVDPRDGASLMDREVKVFIKNKRVYAEYAWTNAEKDLCD